MFDEVVLGLSQPQKEIQPKYFYDARGCELFEAICNLPEYYPTRAELAIMREHAGEMAALSGVGCSLIEIGCGNSEKTRLLLDAAKPVAFVPIDIAREQLASSCRALAGHFPQMRIAAIRADFSQHFALPPQALPGRTRRVLYFPGSTIGNFTPADAHAFLARWAPELGHDGGALVGVDLKKSPARLAAAYNDAQGITAAFNLNILSHINRELGADFNVGAFLHRAEYDALQGRIEMRLQSLTRQRVRVGGLSFAFAEGETIHTENSCKYSIEEFQQLALDAGFDPRRCWTDEEGLFSVHYLRVR